MKAKRFLVLALATVIPLVASEINNPAIEYSRFRMLTQELEPVRAKNRVSEEDFLKMAGEPGTVILDARSRDKFDAINARGALDPALTDFTEEALQKLIPGKTTRIPFEGTGVLPTR